MRVYHPVMENASLAVGDTVLPYDIDSYEA